MIAPQVDRANALQILSANQEITLPVRVR